MRIALVGCGYVADMYMQTLPGLTGLSLAGAYDHDPDRLQAFCKFHAIPAYASMDALLADDSVQMVVNLTNPRSHHAVSRRALESGRHVYSEKPLGMTMDEAWDLVDLARTRGLWLAAAPCNHLSDVVQAMGHFLRTDRARFGRPLMAQAEMDDGLVPFLRPETWRSISGAPWPARDEFEVGCTLEHAGYQITPLVSLFGPVRRVTAFSACLLPDKVRAVGGSVISPDLSVGMLEFDGNIVARITNSIIAPSSRTLRVVCEHGVLSMADVWEYHTPLRFSPTGMTLPARLTRKAEKYLSPLLPGLLLGRRLPVRHGRQVPRTQGGHHMDFSRGVAQLAAQAERQATVRMDTALALHVTEVTLALQDGARSAGGVTMQTDLQHDHAPKG